MAGEDLNKNSEKSSRSEIESKPSSAWKFDSKDVVSSLTSIVAVLISVATFLYTNHHWNLDADAAQKKVLAELIQSFEHMGAPQNASTEDEQRLEIAAMRLAAYGDQALPAVRMAFGASNDGLREGGMLVAKQMYRGMTVKHEKLIAEILGYYKTNSPVLQHSALEWLLKMKRELSVEEGALAVGTLIQTCGDEGEKCQDQDTKVAMDVINFLALWPSKNSKEFLGGMARKCKVKDVCDHAAYVLKVINRIN